MSKQNEILATIETFLKDRNGENFQVSLESDLRKDLQADSVELMEFISILRMNIKWRFQIRPLMNLTQWETLSTISKTNCCPLIEKGSFRDYSEWSFFSVLFIRILLILYGILLKIHFVCDRMKVIKYERRTKS